MRLVRLILYQKESRQKFQQIKGWIEGLIKQT